jgi:hypothetical protein
VTYQDTLLHYIRRHIPRALFAQMAEAGIPLTGPNGIRRAVAERDFEAFIRLYFTDEFTLDFAGIHQQFIADCQAVRDRCIAAQPGIKLGRAIPRGHAKTSYFARLLPLWSFLYGWSKLTVLLGNNATAAQRLLKNIREECETNEQIAEDFGPFGGDVWGENRLEYGNAAIVCFGVGSGAIRGVSKPGARPSLVIGDDLDDDDSVRSAVQLEANCEWFDKSVMGLGDQVKFTTSYIVIGTVIRKSTLLTHILESPDFHTIIQRGVLRFADNAGLWADWGSWFREQAAIGQAPTEPSSDTFYQARKSEMLAGTEVLWPREHGYYLLMVYRLARGEAAFSSEIQNAPGESGGKLGNMKLVSSLPTTPYMTFGALDSTAKGGKANDLAAWVELRYYPHTKQMYVTFANGEQRPYSETISFVVDRLRTATDRLSGVWVETNGVGTIVADLLAERITSAGLFYDPQRVNHSAHKADRISALPEYIARDQLFVLDTVDAELVKEFEGWPGYKYDDVIDALATIILQLKALGYLDIADAPF